ncbi:Transcription factor DYSFUNCTIONAL TAPETUM 1 [Glycine soja]|uniref:Transcription factor DYSFUNCTIONAL TAPETUM 1 n=1 Tax=Glycine soja TaxID=3848 RepID=A0A0B2QBT0_GLYSO|nr:Transcription factor DYSFUNCTIONAL TAPETUM 1 [Glycine soja]
MEYQDEDQLCFTMEEFSVVATENVSSRQRMSRKRNYDDDTRVYKSKNLEIEGRRREKLSASLLMLRSMNPIITNATTGTIIVDAITYIEKLQYEAEVRVAKIDENKLWVKIIIEKKRGRFSKLMEALNNFGIELIDTNLATTKGASLITSCIQAIL